MSKEPRNAEQALRQIVELSDRDMQDGDAAREIATKFLSGDEHPIYDALSVEGQTLAVLMEHRNAAIRACIIEIEIMGPDRLDGLISREKAVAALKALLPEVKP